MFRNKWTRNILLGSLLCILVACFLLPYTMSAIIGTMRAKKPHVNCSFSGTYIREQHQDGSTTWSPSEPTSATISASTTAEGLGKASIELVSATVGKVNGSGGISVPGASAEINIGTWGVHLKYSLLPVWYDGTETLNISNLALVPTADNTYTWTARVKLCVSTVMFSLGSWSDVSKNCKEYDYQGSWVVQTKKVCPQCKKYVDGFTQHQVPCVSKTTWWQGSTRQVYSWVNGCGQKYWTCTEASEHSVNTSGVRVCRSSGSTGSSNGGTTGTTTSPTIGNNGGNGGTSGGTSGGSDTRVRCKIGKNCEHGGWASSRYAHQTTCPAGHSYFSCYRHLTYHETTCRAPISTQVRCGNSRCRSGGWASSRTAHQTTCRQGHTYWSCSNTMSARRHRRH